MAARLPILLVKAGEAAESVRRNVGDYDRWFSDALQGEAVSISVVRPYAGEPLPERDGFAAVIVSGSPFSVTRREGWMDQAAAFLKEAIGRGTPVLGVCFGHQILGHAYGGRVVRNPNGREMGTVRVSLTEAGRKDPLFAGLEAEFSVQATHEDVVVDPPRSIVPLAFNQNTPLQAFRAGGCGWGVQFHPELSAEGLRSLAESRRETLDREGLGAQRVLESITPTAHGRALLANFLRLAGPK